MYKLALGSRNNENTVYQRVDTSSIYNNLNYEQSKKTKTKQFLQKTFVLQSTD